MNKAYIGLGSNIEPRIQYLDEAISMLDASQDVSVTDKSAIYETEPVGYLEQAQFLNMVIEVETSLESEELLTICQGIELSLGRKRIIKNGPRTVDLDILLFNDENKELEKLIIPHPRLHERAFVLVPLFDVAPEMVVSTKGKTVAELLRQLPQKDRDGIVKWCRHKKK